MADLIRSYQMIWSDQIWLTLLTMIMQWSSYGIL
jgi:hypothetical protein